MNLMTQFLCLQSRLNDLAAQVAAIIASADDLDTQLREWSDGEAWAPNTTLARDVDSVPIGPSNIRWPNGVAGVFTAVRDPSYAAVQSYVITYAGTPAKTVTQPSMTRDVNGAVVTKPLLVIS